MTSIKRTVRRRTEGTVFAHGHRRVVVELCPGDMISFRLERTRQRFELPILALFDYAVLCHCNRRQRLVERRAKEISKGGVPMRSARALARKELGR